MLRHPCSRTFRRVACLLILLAGTARGESDRPRSQDSAKAAHLLLFLRYVTWPDSVFASKSAPICACVSDRDPFGAVLDEVLKHGKVQGRALVMKRLAESEDARGCQLAYIGPRSPGGRRDWRRRMRARPVLIVADGEEEGVSVAFVMEGERLRYEVDLEAAERAGLKVAAPMLISARRIRPTAEPPEEGE